MNSLPSTASALNKDLERNNRQTMLAAVEGAAALLGKMTPTILEFESSVAVERNLEL